MDIYERYGRLVEQHEIECEAHRKTVGILRSLKQGEIQLDALTVTDENQWSVVSPDTTEELPVN